MIQRFKIFVFFFVFSCFFNSIDAAEWLSSWNEGPAKKAIIDFIHATTDASSPQFVPPEERIATFDQDGTLWVEQPMYTQVLYCFDRLTAMAAEKPELKETEPFKTVLSGSREALAKLTLPELEKIADIALFGMSTEQFQIEVQKWMATAKDSRWKRLHTDLVYQPMEEVLAFFRANGYKTYIVTGSGQDFVRAYAQGVFGTPPEQILGTIGAVKYSYGSREEPLLIREPKIVLKNNYGGKPEGIHMLIGRRPYAAFGNSIGDQQMLEYTKAGSGARLCMLVLHDDAEREYAYGPAQGLPDTKDGVFTQALYDKAKKDGWIVISMKNDWKQIFSFD